MLLRRSSLGSWRLSTVATNYNAGGDTEFHANFTRQAGSTNIIEIKI